MRIESRTLGFRTGTEGPRHDPYSFTEMTVTVNGVEHTLHLGLGTFYKMDKSIVSDDEVEAQWAFEMATGIKPRKFEEYYFRVHPYFEDPMGHPSRYI